MPFCAMIHCDCPDSILCQLASVACCDNNWMHELPSDNEIYCLFTQLLNAAAQFSSTAASSATPFWAPSFSLPLCLFMLSASWANVGQFSHQLWRTTATATRRLVAVSRSFSIYESDNSQVGAKIALANITHTPRCQRWPAKVNVATSIRDNLLVFVRVVFFTAILTVHRQQVIDPSSKHFNGIASTLFACVCV